MNSSYIAVTVISLVSFSFSVITLYNILMTSWLLLDDNSFAQGRILSWSASRLQRGGVSLQSIQSSNCCSLTSNQ